MTDSPTASVAFPILSMDISDRRIGLAIADNAIAPPHPLFTYQRISRARDLAQCTTWVEKYQVGAVVIGLPLNMDGTPGPRAQWMTRFADELRARLAVPVLLQDERLSTVEAKEAVGARYNADTDVDAIAAAYILQRYLQEGGMDE